MLEKRTFQLVLVRPGHGTGIQPSVADRLVEYDGRKLESRCRAECYDQ